MNIPKKFTFHNGNNLLKLTNIEGTYYCTLPHVEADTISSAYYDRMNVEHKLHTGKWKIVEDLTIAKEPEMKFPFTFKCKGCEDILYTALKGDDTNLYYTFENSLEGPYPINIKNARQSIEDGFWIIQSVGEQEAKEEPTKVVFESENGNWRLFEDGSVISNKLDTFNKTKVENFKESTRLSTKIDCDADEATAKMEKLAGAVEAVVIAFESLEGVMERMGLGGSVNVQTFDI